MSGPQSRSSMASATSAPPPPNEKLSGPGRYERCRFPKPIRGPGPLQRRVRRAFSPRRRSAGGIAGRAAPAPHRPGSTTPATPRTPGWHHPPRGCGAERPDHPGYLVQHPLLPVVAHEGERLPRIGEVVAVVPPAGSRNRNRNRANTCRNSRSKSASRSTRKSGGCSRKCVARQLARSAAFAIWKTANEQPWFVLWLNHSNAFRNPSSRARIRSASSASSPPSPNDCVHLPGRLQGT